QITRAIMAKVTSAEKFALLVEKSKLSSPEKLEKALEEIRANHDGKLPEPASDLADALIEKEIITRWHSDKLILGKYKGFFLGKHKLLGHIGSGGMSSVYLAEHTKMHDLRAIKVLPQSKLGKTSYLARFQQEAKAIASLNHPNIVRAHDIDNEGNTHYIVMEYVDGDDLQTIVKEEGPLDFERVANYTAQSARGLQHAHDVGLIHRDVKPANVLINSKGKVKLLDLGLALFAEDEDASLTMDFNDKVLGTADYLAPEQALNSHKVDHRADLYGLGCTMYFLLTGHPPFPDGTIAQRIAKHQKEMPPEIRKIRPECPGELEGICWKLLQKDPKFRYGSGTQTAEVLDAWLSKYRAAKLVAASGGSSSSVNLGDESDARVPGSGTATVDTVSNRADETMGSDSVTNLSPSDSGVLVRVEKSGDSSAGSTVDLESEIARRSQSRASNSLNGNQPIQGIVIKPIYIVGLVIMFILAVLLGVVIARLTDPDPTPVANPESEELTFWIESESFDIQNV
ncbi:MAG: serine/threonine-protein kinase, partial [Planctomycetota bacterium]